MVAAVQNSGLRGLYTNSRATAPCQPFTIQNMVGTADEGAIATLYNTYVQTYPGLFANVNVLGGVGPGWTGSYCQEGIFPSNNTRFIFCVLYRGTFLATMSVGYPPASQAPPGTTANIDAAMAWVRNWANRASTMVP